MTDVVSSSCSLRSKETNLASISRLFSRFWSIQALTAVFCKCKGAFWRLFRPFWWIFHREQILACDDKKPPRLRSLRFNFVIREHFCTENEQILVVFETWTQNKKTWMSVKEFSQFFCEFWSTPKAKAEINNFESAALGIGPKELSFSNQVRLN